ncbi:[SSU ribosomal protein S18P]-alanine acetyltransferase [Fontibacillus phaseoli]|uniref:[SSU ribosomal protein S18P]-alanine acetyltransferase n=1 Tax=Fontibacillus phaseoli TaxID=1416533 RepID=A0A369BJA8_9BACL|nr:ribosomal protein S18-alanine N-acetyltransferase [Fontibacillus phaseoli]RCX20517.1 [SSU ribosomal protein S18P]-alanine acetyltransferase [Fontibacillus phaseoli]
MNSLSIEESERVQFRSMKLEDIPDIMVIEHESFTLPWSEEAFRNELTLNHFARYIIMDVDGKPAGYAGMWTIVDEAHITNIAVRTAYRGQHLGERLLCQIMGWAGELGLERMTLEVRASNLVAQSLYAKLGFIPAGVRKGYYSDNHEDAIIMWCELPEQESGSGVEEGRN